MTQFVAHDGRWKASRRRERPGGLIAGGHRAAARSAAWALLLAAPLVPVAEPDPVRAAGDFIVTKTADTNDGACSRRDCSLREAIVAANATSGPDFVRVPPGTYRLTIAGSFENAGETGDLDVLEALVVFGAGARRTVVDASGIAGGDRAFDALGAATDLTLQNLTVTGGNPGALPAGGGVRAAGRLNLFSVALRGNRAGAGGGAVIDGALSMKDATVSGNTAGAEANGDGGGLLLNGGASVITNSTISGNATARVGGRGAAIALRNGATLSTINATIAGNRTRDDEEGAIAGAGESIATFRDSVLANGPTANCLRGLDARSAGHNVADDARCGLAQAGDQADADPGLGPLHNNGGPTDTHALRRGSPARDAGSADPLATDQRGVRRPQGKAADVGAVEAGKPNKRRRR